MIGYRFIDFKKNKTMNRLEREFKKIIKYPNIFTPEVRHYGCWANGIYEVSEGIGLDDKPIFGVAVLEHNDHHELEHRHELSQCFFVQKDFRYYLLALRKGKMQAIKFLKKKDIK